MEIQKEISKWFLWAFPWFFLTTSSMSSNGILLVKHSQTTETLSCDDGHTKLWDGYSLTSIELNQLQITLDLGSTGSCVQQLTISPVLSSVNGSNKHATGNDRSFWLSVPNADNLIENKISRCVVCQVPRTVITLHSQKTDVPDCPSGWKGLWKGYSFLAVCIQFFDFWIVRFALYHFTLNIYSMRKAVVAKHYQELALVWKNSAEIHSSNVKIKIAFCMKISTFSGCEQ